MQAFEHFQILSSANTKDTENVEIFLLLYLHDILGNVRIV
jgi:hypothetical protein